MTAPSRHAAPTALCVGLALLVALPANGHGAPTLVQGKPALAAPVAQKGPAPSVPASTCSQPLPADGIVFADLEMLCPIVAEVGSARIAQGDNGIAYIAGVIDGINFALDVYNCEPDCADLTFTSSFEIAGVTNDQMNEWNATRRFGKAYIRDDGDAVIQIAINTRFGLPVETFRDDLVWWQDVLADYVTFIGFR